MNEKRNLSITTSVSAAAGININIEVSILYISMYFSMSRAASFIGAPRAGFSLLHHSRSSSFYHHHLLLRRLFLLMLHAKGCRIWLLEGGGGFMKLPRRTSSASTLYCAPACMTCGYIAKDAAAAEALPHLQIIICMAMRYATARLLVKFLFYQVFLSLLTSWI